MCFAYQPRAFDFGYTTFQYGVVLFDAYTLSDIECIAFLFDFLLDMGVACNKLRIFENFGCSMGAAVMALVSVSFIKKLRLRRTKRKRSS